MLVSILEHYCKEAQKVIDFEPNKYSFELLTKNISLNHLTNIAAYNITVSKKSGAALLFKYGKEPDYFRIIDGDQSANVTRYSNRKSQST
jgi:FkbM family methyltransferase